MTPLARTRVLLACSFLLLALTSCSRGPAPVPVSQVWVAGHAQPAFDPDGPPDALRWALERLLSRGLVERDSSGEVRMAAAESVEYSADSLTLTFRLRANAAWADGAPLVSGDFRAALLGGLARTDHATRDWLLGAITGMDKVRAGKPLPALGVESPDDRTLVLKLARPDSRLLEKLALPGVSSPWRSRVPGDWAAAVGTGPYRLLSAEPGRSLTLVRADSACSARALADTLRVRFVSGAPRARTLLRSGAADLVWPAPPTLLEQPLPESYVAVTREASPARRLLLLFRADMPPTTRMPARYALSHATSRTDLLDALGPAGRPESGWLPGGGEFDFPRFDENEVHGWLVRGKLGASFHVVLAYDADQSSAAVARALQGTWARIGLYAEMRPLRGAAAAAEPLRPAAAHVQLLETQALLDGPEAELASLVMPLRGPAVGSFRSGWRTREFDAWLFASPGGAPFDPVAAQSRLAEERLALPIAGLPWQWVERSGGSIARFHPRFGPEWSAGRN